ncbi:MAG: hypothetical protein IT383_18630 [Deltaproteobacteria bacterium]|nr:hypothetical protein [Deltaproteobacteria bacterium]
MILPLVLAGVASATSPVAVLPVAAEGRVTLEELPQLTKLDAEIRDAARAAGVNIQDQARTTANLESLRGMGISCPGEDATCLAKIAVLAEVDRVVVPVVVVREKFWDLKLVVVDTTQKLQSFPGEVPFEPPEAMRATVRVLVSAALRSTSSVAPPPPLPPPPTPLAVPTPAPAPAPTPAPPPSGGGIQMAGIGLTAAGGLLLVGGGAGAWYFHEALGTPEPYVDREPKIFLGRSLLIAAGVGVVLAGVGGTLIAASMY